MQQDFLRIFLKEKDIKTYDLLVEKITGGEIKMTLKKIKKVTAVTMGAMVLTLSISSNIFAATEDIGFVFANTSQSADTDYCSKGSTSSIWSITLDKPISGMESMYVSSTKIFGCRIRKSSDSTSLSAYYTFSSFGTKTKNYYSTVTKGTSVFLRGKKDDSSSSSSGLIVVGTVTP